MKKKTVGIMLSLSMAMSLMACGSSTQPAAASVDTEEPAATTQAASTAEATAPSTEAAADTAASTADVTTIKDGTLMVGVEIGYPPMEYFDTDGATPIGFDVEVECTGRLSGTGAGVGRYFLGWYFCRGRHWQI